MAIKRGLWIECDECGDGAGDAGVAIRAPFETPGNAPEDWAVAEDQATDHALDNGFTEDEHGRLLCPTCSEPDDEDDDIYDPEEPADL